jgi:hypothetical protein
MTDQTSQQPDEIDALITEAVNAAFDCGEWDDDEHQEDYPPLAEKASIARKHLRDAIDAALKHAQQAVESERDKALEEAAQTCESLELPGATHDWDCGTMDCAFAIRALKSQQPAQADKDKP